MKKIMLIKKQQFNNKKLLMKLTKNNRNINQHKINLTSLPRTNNTNSSLVIPHNTLITLSNINQQATQSNSSFDYIHTETKSNKPNIHYKPIHTSITSFKKALDKKALFYSTNHSIFSLFRSNFKKKFNSNINKSIKQLGKTSYSFNPFSFHKSQITQSPQETQQTETVVDSKDPNTNNDETNTKTISNTNNQLATISDEHKDIITNLKLNDIQLPQLTSPPLQLSLLSSSSSSSNSISFDQPTNINISHYKRIRNIKKYMNDTYIMNSKWKIKEGIYSSDIKYSKHLILDMDFQSRYIKDEMRILLDNIQYMKTNLLCTNDVVTAIKNKDLHFQININKSIEETCGFLDLLSRYILCDYYNYSEHFISIESANYHDMKPTTVTNEVDCFVINIRLLCKISKYLKCCFDVYITLTKQVDDIILPLNRFEVVRRILQRARYNMNDIIQSGKGALKDYYYDKDAIEKIEPLLKKKKITQHDIQCCSQRKRKDLMTHLKTQLEFNKNEFTQKRMRITAALHDKQREEEVSNEDDGKYNNRSNGYGNGKMYDMYMKGRGKGNKIYKKGRGRKNMSQHVSVIDGVGINGPMSIIVSLYLYYVYIMLL